MLLAKERRSSMKGRNSISEEVCDEFGRRRASVARRRSNYLDSDSETEEKENALPSRKLKRTPVKIRNSDAEPISRKARFNEKSEGTPKSNKKLRASVTFEDERLRRPDTHADKNGGKMKNEESLSDVPVYEFIDSKLTEEQRLQELLVLVMNQVEDYVSVQHERSAVPQLFRTIAARFIEASEESMKATLKAGIRTVKKRKATDQLIEHPRNIERRQEASVLEVSLKRIEFEKEKWDQLIEKNAQGSDEITGDVNASILEETDLVQYLRDDDATFLDERSTEVFSDRIKECRMALNVELDNLRQGIVTAKSVSSEHSRHLKRLHAAVRDISYEPYRSFKDAKSLVQNIAAAR